MNQRLLMLFLCCAGQAFGEKPPDIKAIQEARKAITPLHETIRPPQPGDWLSQHEESGQSFAAYMKSKPITPRGTRRVIYIQPVGDFTKEQEKIVTQTADFMSRFFSRKVSIMKPIPLSKIPEKARRVHPDWGVPQVLSTYVLYDLLKPRLPDDAAAFIAFTSSDLWPGKGWNFVFGQASLRERVGVWSIYRNGDPAKSKTDYTLCLLRTLKTAVHETGHMFSIKHCTAYECCMCGANHRLESDLRPLYFCPECVSKVCWATSANPVLRYNKLADFCDKAGLKAEADFYLKSIKAIQGE